MQALFKYPYVEDYIEIIAGMRDPSGKSTGIFATANPAISLARYDMKIIPSLATQTFYNTVGYTDKQAELAAQLILKYERQLAKLGLDVGPVRTPQYRLPIRVIDRSTKVWIEDDRIFMRFPFNAEFVETVRKASGTSQGYFMYNRDKKCHEAALTEWNLNWIYTFAKAHNFEIASSVQTSMDLLLTAEQKNYKIELVYDNDVLTITNASTSLLEYLENNAGGFRPENLLRLCDHAPLLGYTVHKDITDKIIEIYGTRFNSLCMNKNLKADAKDELAVQIVDYATKVNRWPIYVYEPDLSQRLYKVFTDLFDPKEVLVLLDSKTQTINDDTKIIYMTKLPKKYFTETIPLMISSAGMMFGGDREMWLQASEKVVYFSHDVYNKSIQGNEICKLN